MRRPIGTVLTAAAMLALGAGCGTPGDFWFVRHAGADMPVWVRGDTGTGKLLVFLHGGPGDNALAHSDRPVFQALERKMGVAYWDQRASGSSRGDARPDSLTPARFVEGLDLVVDSLRDRHPGRSLVLLGFSWGGGLAAAYLADPARQTKIAGWIDMDGSTDVPEGNRLSRDFMLERTAAMVARGEDAARWQAVHAWYAARPTLDLASFDAHIAHVTTMEKALAPSVQLLGAGSAGLNFLSPFYGPARALNGGYVARAMVLTEAFQAFQVTSELPKITRPTLVLWGRHDARLPLGLGEQVFARVGTPAAQKRLVVLERAAHTGYSEDPQGFEEAVNSFVTSL